MNKQLNTSNFAMSRNKSKHFTNQMKVVFHAFKEQPKTMKMIEVETGIDRANVCRYVSKWKKQNNIEIVSFGICPITKNPNVQFLTTNKALFNLKNNVR